MRYRTRRVPDAEICEFVDNWLRVRTGQEESISYLVEVIRDHGYSFPTNHSRAMDEFERLGYCLRKEHNQYGALLRTYVQFGIPMGV